MVMQIAYEGTEGKPKAKVVNLVAVYGLHR
jgi:hypothetical protein